MQYLGDYEIVSETDLDTYHGTSLLLLRRDDGKMTVVEYSASNGQVYDVMPGDRPSDRGRWYAAATTSGVDYIAGWYSPSWARRVYRRELEAI